MKNIFLKPNNPLLYKVSKKITKADLKKPWFLNIVKTMKKVAGVEQHNDQSRSVMVGLAAPQIGFPLQVVFANLAANSERKYSGINNVFMVNPRVLSVSGKRIREQEGCFSARLTECGVRGIVARSQNIVVEYMTLEGEIKTERIAGFPAVIVQHEVDHLNGKVFVHHITHDRDLHVIFPSEYEAYKKNWRTWKHTMNPETYFKDVAQS